MIILKIIKNSVPPLSLKNAFLEKRQGVNLTALLHPSAFLSKLSNVVANALIKKLCMIN